MVYNVQRLAGQQMLTMKSEVVGHLLMIVFKLSTNKFMEDGASQFQNAGVNFHKFHALFSTRLL
jgi:hypothetical protein